MTRTEIHNFGVPSPLDLLNFLQCFFLLPFLQLFLSVQFSKTSPRHVEKIAPCPGGGKSVESCHVSGCHSFSGPDLHISLFKLSRPDPCGVDFGGETPKFSFEFCHGFFGGFFPPVFSKEKGPKKSTKKSTAKFTQDFVWKNSPRISAEAFSFLINSKCNQTPEGQL